MRKCTKCKLEKGLAEFPKHVRHSTGYSSWCRLCHNSYCKSYYNSHKKAMQERSRKYNADLRREALDQYSNGTMLCQCCSESHYEFLSIDHIDGGGTKHREQTGAGSLFYLWLRKNGWPSGYRVLCHNCNFSMGQYGYCPHN